MVLLLNHACTDPGTETFWHISLRLRNNSHYYIYRRSYHMFVKASLFILERSVTAGTTVILGGVAVAMLGSRCNAVTLMVLNLAATPIELRYTQSLSCLLSSDSLQDHRLANSRLVTDSRNNLA